jgi:hypothetical protein
MFRGAVSVRRREGGGNPTICRSTGFIENIKTGGKNLSNINTNKKFREELIA